jgi:hypothetical protein
VLVIPATEGSINGRILVQAASGKKQEPVSKITRIKRSKGETQTVECLLSKSEKKFPGTAPES